MRRDISPFTKIRLVPTVAMLGLVGCVPTPGKSSDSGEHPETGDSTERPETGESGHTGDIVHTGDSSATDSDSGTDTGAPPTDADGDGVSVGDDCDDGDDTIAPGAAEVYGDGIDQDCDGLDSSFDQEIYGLEEEQYFGETLAVVDSDGDGAEDLWASSPGYARGEGLYLIPGPIDPDYALDGLATWRPLADDSWTGEQFDPRGDLDGDGVPDLAVTSPLFEEDGQISVVYGSVAGGGDLDEADLQISTSLHEGLKTSALWTGGDLDGDGRDDLLFGLSSEGDAQQGAVAVLLGGDSGEVDRDDATAWISGTVGDGYFGSAVLSMGDSDGDGIDDLVAGAPGDFTPSAQPMVGVALGPVSGSSDADDMDAVLEGPDDARAGAALAAADVNGDGYGDLAVGAPNYWDEGGYDDLYGTIYLLYGPITSGSLEDAPFVGRGMEPLYYLGQAVAVRDVDDDGALDLLASTSNSFGGSFDGGLVVLSDLAAYAGSVSLGGGASGQTVLGAPNKCIGAAVETGDLNGDGATDLALGSPRDMTQTWRSGSISLLWGPHF